MNATNPLIILGVILIPIILVVIITRRLNRSLLNRVEKIKGYEPVLIGGIRNAIEVEATVISKNETIVENAGGYAKVNLQILLEIPDKAPSKVTTCWLVEVDSLDLILPGKSVPIKLDPRKPSEILPNIPWAKLWIFGE